MSKKTSIPVSISWTDKSISRLDGLPIFFPRKCVYCGAPQEAIIKPRESITTKKDHKRYSYTCKPPVPYCTKHSRQSINNTSILISVYMFFIIFLVVIISFLSNRIAIQNEFYIGWFYIGLLIFGGIVVSSPLGFLAIVITKLALSPIFKSMADMHLWIPSLSIIPAGALGFSFKIVKHNTPNQPETYTFDATFTNEEYAAEFEQSNLSQPQVSIHNNIQCPTCNAEIQVGDLFCPKCGTHL